MIGPPPDLRLVSRKEVANNRPGIEALKTPEAQTAFLQWWMGLDDDVRPPLLQHPDGSYSMLIPLHDWDGTLTQEVRPDDCSTSYDQYVLSNEALQPGIAYVDALQQTHLNGGILRPSIMTGRSTRESRAIMERMGIRQDTAFTVSCDGGELCLPQYLMSNETLGRLAELGYQTSELSDGTVVINLGQTTQTSIRAMLAAFNTENGSDTAIEMIDPSSDPALLATLSRSIGHISEEWTAASVDRSTSGYVWITREQMKNLQQFATHYGIRIVPSPHVTPGPQTPGVVEIHGQGTAKDSAISHLYTIMHELGIPVTINFAGNGGNDASAAEVAKNSCPESVTAMMPRPGGLPFIDVRRMMQLMDHGVLLGDDVAGRGLMTTMLPAIVEQLRRNTIDLHHFWTVYAGQTTDYSVQPVSVM